MVESRVNFKIDTALAIAISEPDARMYFRSAQMACNDEVNKLAMLKVHFAHRPDDERDPFAVSIRM